MLPDRVSFIPGLTLSGMFYDQAVRPIMETHFPQVAHAAARLDFGSDVLGFDTPQSTDHGWGPRLSLFLSSEDHRRYATAIDHALRDKLPYDIGGYSTNFARIEQGTIWMDPISSGPVNHAIAITTVASFFGDYLHIDPYADISVSRWLLMPEQRLRTIASGRVYHDTLNDGQGELERIRARLRYYPHDVWLYLLAAQWQRISQEEPFMARCGDVGDDLGSRIVAARLVRELMRLCFLMERTYAPYIKWLGTAFARLHCASQLMPIFDAVWRAASWQERERYMSQAYRVVAEMHNTLAITESLPVDVSPFHDRPYMVLHSEEFSEAIYQTITDPAVLRLPRHVGSVSQFIDSTDILDSPDLMDRVRALYQHDS